jgi:hypothetical protein
MSNTVVVARIVGLGILAVAGLAQADTLVPIDPNANISGYEVVSSGTFNGVNQGWFTTAPGQTAGTVNGTGVNNGTPLNVLNLAPNNTSTYNLGDNFSAGEGSNAAADTIAVGGTPQSYSFVDTFVLNLPTSSTSSFDVSFAACGQGGCSGISNLTSRLYQYTAGGANNITSVGTVGTPPGGAGTLVTAWTATQGSGMSDYTQFQNAPTPGGEYVLQVAGLVQPSGGSFGGVLQVTAVPLPADLPLLLSGLLGLGAWSRRRC